MIQFKTHCKGDSHSSAKLFPRLRWKSLCAKIWLRIFSGSVALLASSVAANDVEALSVRASSWRILSAQSSERDVLHQIANKHDDDDGYDNNHDDI